MEVFVNAAGQSPVVTLAPDPDVNRPEWGGDVKCVKRSLEEWRARWLPASGEIPFWEGGASSLSISTPLLCDPNNLINLLALD